MKKFVICSLFGALLVVGGCTPVNPPQSDEDVNAIITVLYNGMCKPANTILIPLSEMGIEVPYNSPGTRLGYDETYYLKTDKYQIRVACRHDSVILAGYEYHFRNVYTKGVKEYYKADDVIYGFCGWEQWIVNYGTVLRDLSQHEAVKTQIDSCVAANKTSHCKVSSYYQKPVADKYLFADVTYWAVSIGGMDPLTGNGRSSMADSEIIINFEVFDTPHNTAFYPSGTSHLE